MLMQFCGGWNQIDHKGRFLGGFMHPNMHSSLEYMGRVHYLNVVHF